MTCAHEIKKSQGPKGTVFHKKSLQSEGGMGFESSNNVVFLLVALLSMEVTLFDFKEAFLVVCEMSFHWFLCGLNGQ